MHRKPYLIAALFVLLSVAFEAGAACTAANPNANVAESTPTSAFTNGNGTVTHNLTGLTWKQCAEGRSGADCATGAATTMTWSAALSAAATSVFDGGGWRLPNKKELESLVEACGHSPAINQTLFPATPALHFWSGSSYVPSPTSAWDVDFYNGYTGAAGKTFGYYVRLVRGGQSFDSFDAQGDFTPDAFTFTAQTGAALSTVATSNTITVAGIDTVSPISIAGGTYSINGGGYTAVAGTVNNGQTVTVQQTSSASFSTLTTATLTIGGVSGAFDVTTLAQDTTPTAFTFTAQTGAALSTVATSDTITVAGINSAANISIAGGTYKINSGSYTSSAGTVNNGQTVTVQQTSSASYSTLTTAILTIGGVAGSFNVTTAAAPVDPVNGVCGAANDVAASSAPSANLCATGPSSAVAGSGPWTWSCYGSDGGSNASCSAPLALLNQTISFGAAPGITVGGTGTATATATSGLAVSFTSTTTGICTVSGSTVTGVAAGTCTIAANQAGNASYNPAPQATQSITVTQASVNGACGSANGIATAFAPSANLCSTGTASTVTAGSPWTWSCNGSGGGTNASCSAPNQTTGGGGGRAVISGGTWADDPAQSAGFIAASDDPSGKSPPNLPPGVSFPYGLFDFTLNAGAAGSAATITITYPAALPAGAVYWKYGPSPDGYDCSGAACNTAHWYQMPPAQAVFAGNTVTLTITDGGVGDDDLAANGVIVDQGGPGVPGGDVAGIPTLSEWALLMLAGLMGLAGMAQVRRRVPL